VNELQRVFDYEGKQVRTVVTDGQPWFVAKDICDVMGLTNPTESLRALDPDEKSTLRISEGGPEVNVINEAGLYTLVIRSNKPEAKAFKRWVTHEVLPSIRKHGIYATDNVIEQIITDPEYGIRLLTALKEERAARLAAEHTNAILMHVNKAYTTTEIAKELGFRSATALNRDLAKRRVQFKQNETWVLYSDYANRGYTEIKQEVLDSGKVIYHRRWTQLGREFLLQLYKREAIA
jgi:prophage antirepressor-like protein